MAKATPETKFAAPLFELADLFDHGTILQGMGVPPARWDRLGRARVVVRRVGKLRLPTGRLVACDPMIGDDAKPFVEELAPGAYPVELSELHGGRGTPRNAAACVRVRRGEVDRWEPMDRRVPAFPVDSATACFVDASALPALAAMTAVPDPMPAYDTIWASTDGRLVLDRKSRANVISFTSGYGDGTYLAWAGRSAQGELLAVAIDLGVVPTSEWVGERYLASVDEARRRARRTARAKRDR